MKKYRITFTGYSDIFGKMLISEILETDVYLYPSDLLTHITDKVGICEYVCNKFKVECEEITE